MDVSWLGIIPDALAYYANNQSYPDVQSARDNPAAPLTQPPAPTGTDGGQPPPPVASAPTSIGTSTAAAAADTGTVLTDLMAAQSSFSTALLQPSEPQLSTAQQNLNDLFENEAKSYEELTEDHWKYPEYPLARIKKIMRMDEDVKMISGEVPVLFSKAIELFVTELTLRAWIYTEETKRRTIQRSDIAMAIAKNDMFDFLIDIVPREEIHTRAKVSKDSSSSVGGGGDGGGTSLTFNPDLLQACMQLLSQQGSTSDTSDTTGGGEKGGAGAKEEGSEPAAASAAINDPTAQVANLAATSQLMQQQLQLLQQLAQASSQQRSQESIEQSQLPGSVNDTANTSSSQTYQSKVPSTQYAPLNVPNSIHTSTTTQSSNNMLMPTVETLHFQPHEHSSTDIVTLLSSSDQLPPPPPPTSQLLTVPTRELNSQQVNIHPRGVVPSSFAPPSQLSVDIPTSTEAVLYQDQSAIVSSYPTSEHFDVV